MTGINAKWNSCQHFSPLEIMIVVSVFFESHHFPLKSFVITLNQPKFIYMKGNKQIIEKLNTLLADELTAVNQYIVHSEMCHNWGYKHLHDTIRQRAIGEMKHAEKLIERILFLEGSPTVGVLNRISIGNNIEEQFKNDREAEVEAIVAYNEVISLAVEYFDNGTAELLRTILADEENHLDWLETQLEQISQVELQNYLLEQIA
jgi:bacterioferritin